MTGASDEPLPPGASPADDPFVGVPERPKVVVVVLRSDGSGTVDGRPVDIPAGADRHAVLMTEACRVAATIGRPVRVSACDVRTEWELIASPDGEVTPVGEGRPRPDDERLYVPGVRPPLADQGRTARPPRVSPPAPVAAPRVKAAGRATIPAVRASTTVATRPGLVGDGPGAGRRASTRPGAVVWSGKQPRRLIRPGLPMLGGLVIGGLVLASLAVVTLPDGGATTADRVVTTVTAGVAAPSPGTSSGGSPAVSSGPSGAPSGARPAGRASDATLARGARLTVAVPPGFDPAPVWTAPIAAWSRSVAADGGTVLSRDPEGHLVLLDPATGAQRWRSAELTASTQDGPWSTTVGGARAAALVTPGVLSYWTLPAAATPVGGSGAGGSGSGVGVRLPAGAKVTWVGSSPLVTVPGGGAGVVRGGMYLPVPMPKGGRALATDGTTVLVTTGTTFVQQPAGRPAVTPRALPRPKGAGARPVRVEGVGTAFLLTVWPRATGRGQIVGLIDARSGELAVQTTLATTLDLTHAGVVREVAGTQTLLGSVLVDTYTSNLNLLDPRYAVRSVTRGHAWAMFRGRATDIHLNRAGDFTTVPFSAGEAALPVGTVAAGAGGFATAVIVAPLGAGWILCGLRSLAPRGGATPSASAASPATS